MPMVRVMMRLRPILMRDADGDCDGDGDEKYPKPSVV